MGHAHASIPTERKIANKPCILIKDKNQQRCIIIDVVVAEENNTSVKFTEKLSKYKDLEIEIGMVWSTRNKTTLVIVWFLGLVKEGLEKFTNGGSRQH